MKGRLVNKQKFQSGFAHLIIFVVLVVALICGLGFVYYDNYADKNSEKTADTGNESKGTKSTDNSQTKSEDSESDSSNNVENITRTASGVSSDGYLIVKEWGVKGIYNSRYRIQYELIEGTISLTSPDTGICSSRALKMVYKYSADDIVSYHGHLAINNPQTAKYFYDSDYFGDQMKKVGNYYYVLEQGITDACSDDSAIQSGESEALAGIGNFFSTLEEQ